MYKQICVFLIFHNNVPLLLYDKQRSTRIGNNLLVMTRNMKGRESKSPLF